MTHDEARARAIAIWGPRVAAVSQWGDDWWIELDREASVHRLDRNGRVVCHHDMCFLAEQRIDRGQLE